MKRVMRAVGVAGILVFMGGCSSGDLKVEPSEYGLTPEVIAFLDEIESSPETMEFLPIPYVAKGKATNHFVDAVDWFLLYTALEQVGKLEDGYAYQDISIIWPVWIGAETHLYDAEGQTTGSRGVDSIGLYWPLPMTVLASFFVERSKDLRLSETYTDVGLKLLQLPVARTCLLKISSAGFDLLFIPLWTADRSPPREASSDAVAPEAESPATSPAAEDAAADQNEEGVENPGSR